METKQAIKEKTIVFINGRPANIIKNKGVGNEWKIENSNFQNSKSPILRDLYFLIFLCINR